MGRRAATIMLIAVLIPLLACVTAVAVMWLVAPPSTMETGLLVVRATVI